jgi:phosphatidylethanolamine/phosphatidyl-N-methylethanolamine N-methyltransferase
MVSDNFSADDYYSTAYNYINSSAMPNSFVFKTMHRLLEKQFPSNWNLNILEIGGNRGEHLPFVTPDYQSYTLTDIRKPNEFMFKADSRVQFELANVENLHFPDHSFDRIIVTCVFHHLINPEQAFRELRRVIRRCGTISILLPNDPGIMYRLLRGLTTMRNARTEGLLEEIQLVHALEHRNHYLSLRTIAEWVYQDLRIEADYFPFKLKAYNLNAVTILHVKQKN